MTGILFKIEKINKKDPLLLGMVLRPKYNGHIYFKILFNELEYNDLKNYTLSHSL